MSEAPDRIWAKPYLDDKGEDWGFGHWDSDGIDAPLGQEYIRADLARATVAAVKVKPLEWEERGTGYFVAATEVGIIYAITEYAGMMNPFKLELPDEIIPLYFPDFDAAKAAAQADHERRVLGALAQEDEG